MHAAVQSAFPPGAIPEGEGRALWRIDKSDNATALIIASPVEPDLTHLVEQAGWQTGEMWQTRPYRPLLDSLATGQRWAFRLVANPTYAGRKAGWEDTKPRAHTTVKQQEAWFLARCESWGFEVPDGPMGVSELRVAERETLRFARNQREVTVAKAAYEGVLDVTDPDLLRTALTAGVGRAKAYGCGLMTLARIGAT